MGEWDAITFSELSHQLLESIGGEMNILLCLENTVSGQSLEFSTLHQQASQMLAAVNTGSFSPVFFKQRFQAFFFLFIFSRFQLWVFKIGMYSLAQKQMDDP